MFCDTEKVQAENPEELPAPFPAQGGQACFQQHLLLFIHQVMSNSFWPHGLQAYLSLTISQSLPKFMSIESVMPSNHLILCHPFSSCLQSFPASGSFPMNWLFASGGQSIGISALVLLMNIQGWFPLGLTGLISLLSKGLSRVFSSTTFQKHQFFGALAAWNFTLTSPGCLDFTTALELYWGSPALGPSCFPRRPCLQSVGNVPTISLHLHMSLQWEATTSLTAVLIQSREGVWQLSSPFKILRRYLMIE